MKKKVYCVEDNLGIRWGKPCDRFFDALHIVGTEMVDDLAVTDGDRTHLYRIVVEEVEE